MTASGRAKVLKAFSTELAIMVKLRSPRIVQVFGVVTTDTSYLGLVGEMCAGGALREALEAEDYATAVDEAQRRRWLLDVALGMSYLYSKGVEHRDLKSLNVLLDGGRRCPVAALGAAVARPRHDTRTPRSLRVPLRRAAARCVGRRRPPPLRPSAVRSAPRGARTRQRQRRRRRGRRPADDGD